MIANPTFADDLQNIQTYESFRKIENNNYTDLSIQGGISDGETGGEGPIGGLTPDYNSELTMVGKALNIQFNNTETNHYWGYGNNVSGQSLNANPFILERLVSRVAIQKIELFFQDKSLDLEGGGLITPSDYSVYIDKVFMVNAQSYISTFGFNTDFISNYNTNSGLHHSFGIWDHTSDEIASSIVHEYLTDNMSDYSLYHTGGMANLTVSLNIARNYDITESDSPVWFYLFQNYKEEENPTILLVCLRFNYRSKEEIGRIKTTYAYYPVIINAPGNGYTEHNYIRPNYQYGIEVSIRGLGNLYDISNAIDIPVLRVMNESLNQSDFIEITENVGKNLFNWTGSKYTNQ